MTCGSDGTCPWASVFSMMPPMNNLLGLGLSYVFVFLVLAAAAYLQKRLGISAEVTRKIIHISVSHWWLLLMFFFDNLLYAVIGPISFIAINYLSYRYHLMPAMELKESRKNLGTVYFPISLLVLVILGFLDVIPLYAGAVGIFIMGYGDGFASLFGQEYGRNKMVTWGGTKSSLGTAVMFCMSAAVTGIITYFFHPAGRDPATVLMIMFVIAGTATAVEVVTPFGLDNITVPIVAALLYGRLI